MPPSTDHPHGDGARDEPEGPTQDEIDRLFAEMVSGPDLSTMELPATPPAGPTPEPPASAPSSDLPAPTPRPDPPPQPPRADLGGPRDYAPPDEPDEPFQPPEPEPLSSADPIRLLAWTGAIGAPIVLLLMVMLWPSAPAVVWLTLLAATLVGWGVAFSRLPRSRDDDDDGAVV